MALDHKHSKEGGELDSTDKLPILEGVEIGEDVHDDAVHMDSTAVLPGPAPEPEPASAQAALTEVPRTDFSRPSAVDLPSLAQSVRSVEERIARQVADYEALSRLYEKSRDAESAAVARATALSGSLTSAQSALAVEEHRAHELERALADTNAAADSARARLDETLRDAEQHQGEFRTLREALAARDATIVQVLHSLGERDAQLHALQREHAQTIPALEARSQASLQMQSDLHLARDLAQANALELRTAQQTTAELASKLKQADADTLTVRRELSAARAQAEACLEALQTHEWRRGFDQNLFLDWDERTAAARAGHGMLQAERDRLKDTAAVLSGKLIEQEEAIAARMRELEEMRRQRGEIEGRLAGLESECKRWQGEVAAREESIVRERAHGALEAQRVKELTDSQAEVQRRLALQRERIAQLEADAETREEEMIVLLAHLNELRRPAQSGAADAKRLSEELAQRNAAALQLSEENRELRAQLERTKGALEEREFLIRRLERSENNNANALGRIQTTIEKLGTPPPPASSPVPGAVECSAEFTRLDGDRAVHALGRRTRIGRAPGCEVQIDAASVSRYHALVIKGQRELIIEDLNSTNGVMVNGRKISRYGLHDGDLVTIGEIPFKCSLKMPVPELTAAESALLELTAPPGEAMPGGAVPGSPAPATAPAAPPKP